MQKIHIYIIAIFIAISTFFSIAGTVNAADCNDNLTSTLTSLGGNGQPAVATITNHGNCIAYATIISYKVYIMPPSAGWLSKQTLYDSKTVMLMAGETKTVTAKNAGCMMQTDVWKGEGRATFFDDNPTSYPTILDGHFSNDTNLCTTCTNECTNIGEKKCTGDGYKTCGNYDSDSCLEWSEVTDCGGNKTCSNGSCISTCTNECSTNGQRVCDGNGWKQCGNYDSDSCLEWSSKTFCGLNKTCSNGSCISACQDRCILGQFQCSGSSARTCQSGGNCTAWGNYQQCDSRCYRCGDGRCECGENRSSCPQDCGYDTPTVDIQSSGAVTCGKNATISWTSTNATSCKASGSWSGDKTTSGSESVGNFTGSKTYTITCTNGDKSANDSVTLTGTDDKLEVSAGSDKDVDYDDTVVLSGSVDGDYDSISWSCTDGELSNRKTLRPTYTPDDNNDSNNSRTYTCTLTAKNECGSDSDSMKVTVNRKSSNFNVALTTNPESGCAPLKNVDLVAKLSNYGSSDYKYTYYFDCDNDGDWEKTITTDDTSYTATDLCDYDNIGTHTAKVKVTSHGRTVSDTNTIQVNNCEKSKNGQASITKTVRNLSTGGNYQGTVSANPGDMVSYKIVITGITGENKGVMVYDSIPAGIINISNLEINGASNDGNLASGINIGQLKAGDSATITYDASVSGESDFTYGQTTLTNTATVTVDGESANSSAAVVVNRHAVQGATIISTGFDGNMFAGIGLALSGMVLTLLFVLRQLTGKKKAKIENLMMQDQHR